MSSEAAPSDAGSGSLLGRAYVSVRADMSKLGADLNTLGPNFLKAFSPGRMFSNLTASQLTATAITKALSVASEAWNENMSEGIKEAEQMIATSRRLSVALQTVGRGVGLSSDELKKFASELGDAVAIDDDEIEEAMAQLTRFTSVTRENFTRTIRVGTDLAALFGGKISEKTMVLGKALENPQHAMAQLTRSGISLSKSQKDLVDSLAKVGDTAGAQNAILDSLEKSYGGAAEKMVTQTKRLRVELQKVREEMGITFKRGEPMRLGLEVEFSRFQAGLSEAVQGALDDTLGEMPLGGKTTQVTTGNTGQDIRNFLRDPQNWGHLLKSGGSIFGAMVSRAEAASKNKQFVEEQGGAGAAGAETEDNSLPSMRKGGGMAGGFFDAVSLHKRLQEQLLKPDDEMVRIGEKTNTLLEKIASNTSEPTERTIPVEGER